MPIFEYRCRSCDEVSEIWEGVGTRNDSRECKHCGGREIERLLSPSHPAKNPRPQGSTCCGREATMRKASLLFRGNLPERLMAAKRGENSNRRFTAAGDSNQEVRTIHTLSGKL